MSDAQSPALAAPRRIGVIGLGVMGGGIAQCLLRKGHHVTVFARRAAAAARWRNAGAHVAESPGALGAACGHVVLSLPDDAAVDAVMAGGDGLATGLAPGACVVDTSTIGVATARKWAQVLAGTGRHYLDAPVSGGQQGARDGTLVAMVGGDRATYEATCAMAGDFCASFVHVGPSGAGQVVKAANQIAVAGAFLGVAEALALAGANGVDLATVRQALLAGSARSVALERHGQRVIDQAFTPGFRAALMRKDLAIASRAALESSVTLRAAPEVLALVDTLCRGGHGGLDWTAIALLVTGSELPEPTGEGADR